MKANEFISGVLENVSCVDEQLMIEETRLELLSEQNIQECGEKSLDDIKKIFGPNTEGRRMAGDRVCMLLEIWSQNIMNDWAVVLDKDVYEKAFFVERLLSDIYSKLLCE